MTMTYEPTSTATADDLTHTDDPTDDLRAAVDTLTVERDALLDLVADLRTRLDDLDAARVAAVDDAASARVALAVEQIAHTADVATIGDRLVDEANRRGWCSDYDRIVEELNDQLRVTLPLRLRTYRVEVLVAVEVEATDEDTARADARTTVDDCCGHVLNVGAVSVTE